MAKGFFGNAPGYFTDKQDITVGDVGRKAISDFIWLNDTATNAAKREGLILAGIPADIHNVVSGLYGGDQLKYGTSDHLLNWGKENSIINLKDPSIGMQIAAGILGGGVGLGKKAAKNLINVGEDLGKGLDGASALKKLEGKQNLKRTLSDADVTRSKRFNKESGQYIGAPPGVDSPQKLGAMVTDYNNAMIEGFAGRNFYKDSSKDIYERTGGNKEMADKFAQNLAILSRRNNVGGNTTMSAKAAIQSAAGEPISTGRFPTKDSPPLQELYDASGTDYLGYKRDPFATQLGVKWSPRLIGRGVNDMHEAELMGYPTGNVGGKTQHAFMDEVRGRAIDKANKSSLGGISNWNTGTAQAAAWSGNKIRRGDIEPGDAAKSYADYLPIHEANATFEAVPGESTNHLGGLLSAPFETIQKFTDDPRGNWVNDFGRDMISSTANLLPGKTESAVGRFKGGSVPAYIARPLTATETRADESRGMTQGSKDAMDAEGAFRGYFDAQDGSAWHKLQPAKNADLYDGASIEFSRGFTPDDMKKIAPIFEEYGYGVASAPKGVTILANDGKVKGFGEKTKLGKEFGKEIRKIIKSNKSMFEDVKTDFGRLDKGYIDFEGAAKNSGPSPVTHKMLDSVNKSQKIKGLLGNSQEIKDTILAKNIRDADYSKQGFGKLNPKYVLARKIFSESGWKGIEKAAAKGLLPAAAVAFIVEEESSQENPNGV